MTIRQRKMFNNAPPTKAQLGIPELVLDFQYPVRFLTCYICEKHGGTLEKVDDTSNLYVHKFCRATGGLRTKRG